MSDPLDATTPSADETTPDPREPEDPAQLQSAESLDEDELGTDPLERGVEPPEHWSPVAEGRPTPREQREGDTLDEHLAAEVPDRPTDEVDKPLAETRMHELDTSVDERAEQEVRDAGE
jgi:hypothetical protein